MLSACLALARCRGEGFSGDACSHDSCGAQWLQARARTVEQNGVEAETEETEEENTGTGKGKGWKKFAKIVVSHDTCDDKHTLNLNRQTANNLGGQGPVLTDPPYMFFEDVFPLSGETIYLKISNMTEYKLKSPMVNGEFYAFTQVNIACASETKFRLDFLKKQAGEYVPTIVPSFLMTFFDFDTGKLGTASESMSIEPVVDYAVDSDTHLDLESFSGGQLTCSATEQGTFADNPTNPFTLTDLQKQRALSVTIRATNKVVIDFRSTAANKNKPSGRNFLFCGPSSLVCEEKQGCDEFDCEGEVDSQGNQLTWVANAAYFVGGVDTCCTEKAYCSTHSCPAGKVLRIDAAETQCSGHTCGTNDDAVCCEDESALCERVLDLTHLDENNLDGKGPQTDAPGDTMTFSNVFPKYKPVDLVITAVSPYSANNVDRNGHRGPLGCVNVLSGTSVKLRFTFVNPTTREPQEIPGFYWSIYDFDTGKAGWGTEKVVVEGFANYYVTPSTEILAEGAIGSMEFFGTTRGTEVDNPTGLLDLNARQMNRAVTFEFKPTSSFDVTFGASASKRGKKDGRNILFAGTSALKCSGH